MFFPVSRKILYFDYGVAVLKKTYLKCFSSIIGLLSLVLDMSHLVLSRLFVTNVNPSVPTIVIPELITESSLDNGQKDVVLVYDIKRNDPGIDTVTDTDTFMESATCLASLSPYNNTVISKLVLMFFESSISLLMFFPAVEFPFLTFVFDVP